MRIEVLVEHDHDTSCSEIDSHATWRNDIYEKGERDTAREYTMPALVERRKTEILSSSVNSSTRLCRSLTGV
jgi:hypothetical protein